MSDIIRLDIRLHELYPDISRAQLQRFIKEGLVAVNGQRETVAKRLVNSNDRVRLQQEIFIPIEHEKVEIPVIYEDDNLVVINKPAGLLSHSKGAYNPEPTVATWLAHRLDRPVNDREGIVHRLDRGTSGVMILAKNETSHAWLQKQFSGRRVKKTYVARIVGTLSPPEANIDLPIERNPKLPQRFRVGHNGKSAQTYYKVIKELPGEEALVELRPTTGRTHQLRVHLEYMGHPIIGDTFYGGRKADRLFLHASSLEITLPTKERSVFAAPIPKNFNL